VVAVEGASAAGKTTAVVAVARATGWTVVPEAYRRLSPPPSLRFDSAAELLDLEERLLREDSRRYSEARSRARGGETVIADTGFLGPLTYTWALIAEGAVSGSVLAPLRDLCRGLGDRGEWGLADAYVYLDTSSRIRAARTRADPAGPPSTLARRHRQVGDRERDFYLGRFAPLLGTRFRSVRGDGVPSAVARRVMDAVRELETLPPPGDPVDAVLALFEEGEVPPRRARGNR
jgi:hypothetical protein